MPWPIEIDDFPSELNLHLFWGFSMAMLNNQMVFWGNHQPPHLTVRVYESGVGIAQRSAPAAGWAAACLTERLLKTF